MIGNMISVARRPAVRRTVAGTAALLVAVAGLTACASGEPTGNASSFADVSGSAVPVVDDLTALCAQIVDQKLDADTGAALAEGSGYVSRVVKIDGQPQAATADARDDRMTFEVENNVIVGCTVG